MQVRLNGYFTDITFAELYTSLLTLVSQDYIKSVNVMSEEEFTIESTILFMNTYSSKIDDNEFLMNAEFFEDRDSAETFFSKWAENLRRIEAKFQIELYEENAKNEFVGATTYFEN